MRDCIFMLNVKIEASRRAHLAVSSSVLVVRVCPRTKQRRRDVLRSHFQGSFILALDPSNRRIEILDVHIFSLLRILLVNDIKSS